MNNLSHWVEELKKENKPIIVEGKKDKAALERFEINNIFTLKKPIYQIIEDLSKYKECIILTDLDSEGKRLFNNLRHQLQKRGIKINNKFRNFLFKETRITNIESIKYF